MPYATNADLPGAVRNILPDDAQTIYLKVWNAAYEKYGGDKPKAIRLAWEAVKKSYEETDGTWTKKAMVDD